jgi:hypothetical protein
MTRGTAKRGDASPIRLREVTLTGTDDLRGQEYSALMSQASGLGRTSQLCWTGALVAAAVLLSIAIGAKQPGLLLPVEFCTAFGFYATVRARRECGLIVGYVQEFHETEDNGAQWCTRLTRLHALPALEDHSDWLPLALANALTLVSVVFGWVFAHGAAHGELLAGFVTMAGVGFCVHSIAESRHLDRDQSRVLWAQMNTGLREVAAGTRRTGTSG